MTTDEAIFAYIKTQSGITDLIGTGDDCRAYPDRAPEGVSMEYLVWQAISGYIPHAMGSDTNFQMERYEFNSYGQSKAEADALAVAVETAFKDYSGTMGGGGGVPIQRIFKESPRIGYPSEDIVPYGAFRIRQEFAIWIGD